MIVTEVRFTNCVNVWRACESNAQVWRMLMPKESVSLLTISAAMADRQFSATQHLDWRTTRGCTAAGDSSVTEPQSGPTWPPETTQIVMPSANRPPKGVHGTHITFFVNASGVSDSVTMTNITDAKYAANLRKAMMMYRFRPGVKNGCPVSGVTSMDITF